MGALDALDMSLKLSKEEEAERLEAAQRRLLELRLDMAGLTRDDGRLGPPLCVLFEGVDASGKGGAIKRLVASLDPRHVRVAQFAAPDPRREAAPLSLAVRPRAAGLGRHGGARPVVVRARARRARRGLRDRRAVVARVHRDRRVRADARARGHAARQVLAAHLRRGAAQAVQGAREGPAEGMEADRRGLAQPREARRSTRRRSRTCSSTPTTSTRRGMWSRRTRSATRASR